MNVEITIFQSIVILLMFFGSVNGICGFKGRCLERLLPELDASPSHKNQLSSLKSYHGDNWWGWICT